MRNGKSSPKIDNESNSVVRPLIKSNKGLGGFMKFLAAYVPATESWIVIGGDQIFKKDLTEESAKNLTQILNSEAWIATKVETEAEQTRIQNALLDFEKVWHEYPRKLGKKLGITRLKNKIKTPEKFTLLMQAVSNYKNYCEQNRIEEKFQKHFSTWVNSWEDWIPQDSDVSSLPQLSFDDISKKIQF